MSAKKNTPKGALCKYSNSFEERLLNCEALREFFKVWEHFFLNNFQLNDFSFCTFLLDDKLPNLFLIQAKTTCYK